MSDHRSALLRTHFPLSFEYLENRVVPKFMQKIAVVLPTAVVHQGALASRTGRAPFATGSRTGNSKLFGATGIQAQCDSKMGLEIRSFENGSKSEG